MLDAQRSLDRAAVRQNDIMSLEQTANQIIALQPWSPEGYGLRALPNINRKVFASAESDVRKAIEVAPQNPYGYVQMGNLRLAQGQYSGAVAAYNRRDRNPSSTDALRGVMNAYIAQKQTDRAIAVAEAQIARSPQQ